MLHCIVLVVCSVNVSVYMSAKPESRWAMPAGSCTAWSTVSSLTARCPVTRPSEEVTTRSTRSSVRLEPANTFHVPSSLIWSQL